MQYVQLKCSFIYICKIISYTLMDSKFLEHQLKNFKLREVYMEKRSKFLKEWRERWVVITQNYLFTFKSDSELSEPTDVLDLKMIKSIKSYVKRYEDRQMSTFKLATEDSQFYFRCKSVPEKWSWIVFFERLLEHKNNGSTNYNEYESIKKQGFISVQQFEKKILQAGTSKTVKCTQGFDLGKILKVDDQEQLKKIELAKKLQLIEKEKQQEQAEKAEKAEQQRLKVQKYIISQQSLLNQKHLQQQQQRRRKVSKQFDFKMPLNPPPSISCSKVSELKNVFQKKLEGNVLTKQNYPTPLSDKSSIFLSPDQAQNLKKYLLNLLSTVKNQELLGQTLKTIISIHPNSNFQYQDIKRSQNIIQGLQKTSKSDVVVEIAKKAKETFNLVY